MIFMKANILKVTFELLIDKSDFVRSGNHSELFVNKILN